MVFFVYKLTFSNSKVYIGMSRTDKKGSFGARYRNHASDARRGKDNLMHAAWRKHGAPVQTILSIHEKREDCALAEIASIKEYDSLNHDKGYNLMAGGEGLNAPAGSAMYALMREKVWNNSTRRKKLSDSLRGRKPSAETIDAYKKWAASPEGKARRTDVAVKMWSRDGHREMMAEHTRKQMTKEAKAHLSKIRMGHPDERSLESRERHRIKVSAFMNSPEGKEIARRGQSAMWANPENRRKVKAATDKWRESDRNKEHCKEIAKLSAKACSRKVRLIDQDLIFNSQREMARHYGVSEASVSHWVKDGKAVRI